MTFEAISGLPCLALLGEPGIGKSHALEAEQKGIFSKIQQQGGQVLALDINAFGNEITLNEELFKSLEFNEWLKGNHQLHIFLDSFDECRLRIDNLATFLVYKFKRYRNEINRLNLRIACRTAVWPAVLEEGLKEIWGQDNVGIYELAPLRRVDVSQAAKIAGIQDSEAFLEEINQKNVVPLAIKPITLEFIIKTYHRNGGQFLPNQRLHELYFEGCLWLCEERNKSRISSKLIGNIERQKRLIVAARIAAITIFGNKFAIWTDVDWGDVSDDDVLIEKICKGTESFEGREFEICRKTIEEVLDTGLFSSRGELNRIGWAHQTYAEFLAAWYLIQHNTPLNQVLKLISSPEDSGNRLIPQLHETAAWLSSMRKDVLEEIMKTDPDVLLQSDIPADDEIRSAIVENLLKKYEQEKLNLYGKSYPRYDKLQHSGLATQLLPYIYDSSKPNDARDVAIDIAEACNVNELQDELVNLALDSSQYINIRASAANAIVTLGNASIKLRLKPLAIGQIPEDEDDQLKGYALRATWPEHLTAEELFNILTPPKRRNFAGAYCVFLDFELAEKLQPTDLLVALSWVVKQDIRCFEDPFERLADVIMLKAWEHFELPGIAEYFVQASLIQWKEYQEIMTSDNELKNIFKACIINDVDKRRNFINQAVIQILLSGEDSYFVLSGLTDNILQSEDVLWMLGKLQNIDSQEERIWSRLMQWSFNRKDEDQVYAIYIATQTNNILCEEFAFYFSAIDLDSEVAQIEKAEYQRRQQLSEDRQNSPLSPPPKERIILLLEQMDLGNLSAWWQLHLEMSLKPDSRFYNHEFESDLTKLPGWEEADVKTRKRIINGAKKYIKEYNQVVYNWIGTNTFDRPALSGCRALQLLLKETPEFLDTLSSEVWQRWASVIVAFPNNSQREQYYIELVKLAYINAPTETLNTLMLIIDKENEEHDYISIIYRFEKCWDERFKAAVLEKAKDVVLKPKCLTQLLEELLKHESTEARKFAQSLVYIPLPLEEEAYQKAVLAAKELVGCAEPVSWEIVWSAIQQDTNFGREVFEAVANRYSHGVYLPITEKQLADLYIWLVQQYPHAEDPRHDGVHLVGVRESIAGFRDNVLTQLRETGTSQACSEIERISEQFHELTWLKRTLFNAKNVMRRKNWQQLQPEEILQIVSNKIESQPTHIQAINLIMQDANNPIINFNNLVNAANINSTINGDQIQHNYAPKQNLVDAFDEIQQIFNRLTENHQPSTEIEKQKVVTAAIEQVNQNPTLKNRLKAGGQAFIFEALQKASDQWWVSPFVKAIEAGIKGE
ncbi:NACHT domain-containing protein [Nostoc spongiaeforme]|uniref:NACHT domain-containing protein n=1 Tax=Nostoc spongiaeforme TaxID=502487 RepID=UPI0018F03AD1|nr:hypothetical protein [Nostoc spongiaeforme]